MTSRRAAAIVFGLPLVWGLAAAPALAEDGATSVAKKTPNVGTLQAPRSLTEPQDELRPSLNDETTGAIDPDDELPSSAMDEGAAWEAVVEAATTPTPLIGDKQAQAVSASTPISTGSPTCRAVSSRWIRTISAPPAASTCSARARSGSTTRRRARSGSSRTAPFSPSRIPASRRWRNIPSSRRPSACCSRRPWTLARDARIVGVESQQGSLAISLEDKAGDAAGRIKLMFDANPDLKLKQWQITDAQGLTTSVTVADVVSGRRWRLISSPRRRHSSLSARAVPDVRHRQDAWCARKNVKRSMSWVDRRLPSVKFFQGRLLKSP